MDKFIYCFDEETKEQLLCNQYQLITTQSIDNKQVYIFENKINSKFDVKQLKVYTTNRMNF